MDDKLYICGQKIYFSTKNRYLWTKNIFADLKIYLLTKKNIY